MAKAKTSKKRVAKLSPFDDMPAVALRHPEQAVRHSPTMALQDVEFVMRALWGALVEGDQKAFKEILKAHYEAMNISRALKRAHLSPRTFYDAVSDRGNPRLTTIAKLVQGISVLHSHK